MNPKSKGVRFVLVYLEQVEKGKAPADKCWLHMGYGKGQLQQSAHTTVTYQFKEHIFPFIRSRKVTMVNFEAILHSLHFLPRNISRS